MVKKTLVCCCMLAAVLTGPSTAWALPIVELEALGGYPDPHDITVAAGTPVRLSYTMSYVTDLSLFQNSLTLTGNATGISATAAGTWWGAQLTTSLSPLTYQSATGLYILLGETSISQTPYSYSSGSEASLAFVDLVPQEGMVTVDLLSVGDPDSINMWWWNEPYGTQGGETQVDLQNSRPLVTIHVGQVEEIIPEPASALILALGAALCARHRRRAGRASRASA